MKKAAALLAVLLPAVVLPAAGRDLLTIPAGDHFPLYIDKDTVKRNGKTVSFSYVVTVPKGFGGNGAPDGEKISNEIETVIDCAAETYSLGTVKVYGQAKAQGPVEKEFPGAEARKQFPIAPRSTAEYLAEFICR